jgi:two-component system phosphate regulon response regulator PhoB
MGKDTKILIIDSEPDFLKNTGGALKKSYTVVTASKAEEGLNKAEQENPDAIILGYLKPRGTSFNVHEELRSRTITRDIPLLIVDVRPEEHSRKGWRMHEGLKMNAEDYISRPVESVELIRSIEGAIRRTSVEPMGLREASEQLEKALERLNKIEELLIT